MIIKLLVEHYKKFMTIIFDKMSDKNSKSYSRPPSGPMSGGNSGAPMSPMQEKKIRKAAKEAIRRLGLKKRK